MPGTKSGTKSYSWPNRAGHRQVLVRGLIPRPESAETNFLDMAAVRIYAMSDCHNLLVPGTELPHFAQAAGDVEALVRLWRKLATVRFCTSVKT